MRSKEFKTKIYSHADSLILALSQTGKSNTAPPFLFTLPLPSSLYIGVLPSSTCCRCEIVQDLKIDLSHADSLPVPGMSGHSYWRCTGWPLTRWPVFLMGCAAGSHRVTPANCSPCHTDRDVAVYVALIVGCCWLEQACGIKLLSGYWLQLLCPSIQLSILMGMANEGINPGPTGSWFSWICQSRMVQWLGKISMALYLVHMLVFQYAAFMQTGPVEWPGDGSNGYCDTRPITLECHQFTARWSLNIWSVPLLLVLSMGVAALLERFVEEPMRRWLRSNPLPHTK